jgi:hypothetical protein
LPTHADYDSTKHEFVTITSEAKAIEGTQKITGIAAIPRVSRNGRLYLPEDLQRNDGVTTPLLWQHDGTPLKPTDAIPADKIIGTITYRYDPLKQQLLYDAVVHEGVPLTDGLGISLGAFYNKQHVCGSKYCYEIAKNLRIVESSLVMQPGMPETTVKLVEHVVEQCDHSVNSLSSESAHSNSIMAESTTASTVAPAQAATVTTTTTSNTNSGQIAQPAYVTGEQFIAAIEKVTESYKNSEQKQLEKLTEMLMLALPKAAAATPAAPVSDAKPQPSEAQAEFTRVTEWFSKIKGSTRDTSGIGWSIDKEAYLQKFGYDVQSDNYLSKAREDVTYSTKPIGYVRKAVFIPGGRMKVPIRQFCDFKSLSGEGTAAWYTMGGVDFAAGTEGSDPFVSVSSQTVAQVTAVPVSRGAFQKVGYSQIEDQPFDLVGTINMAYALAGIDDEAAEVLSTVYGAITPTNWVRGDTGAVVTSDNIASNPMQREGIVAAKRLISQQGYDVSPGNLVLFLHPKQYQELLLDTDISTYMQYARSEITATGVMEQLYGVDIVIADQVQHVDTTTNDTYRAVMAVKGHSFGLASARDITMEASRRNELQQVFLTGTQRVKGAVLDEKSTCRISTTA